MTPFGLVFCAVAFVIFGGAVVHRAAREQGRNEIGWTAGIVLASALAVACGTRLVRLFTRRTEELWMLTLPLPLLAGVAALAAGVVMLRRLPNSLPAIGAHISGYRLGDAEGAGADCVLALLPGYLELRAANSSTITIARASLVGAVLDGECVHIRWQAAGGIQALRFRPAEASRLQCARVSQAIAARLSVASPSTL